MKRIAALAALVITLLAVPAATAMASTSGSGTKAGEPGYGRPGSVQVACPLPHRFPKGHYKVKGYGKAYALKHRHGKRGSVRIACPHIPAKPLPKSCKPKVLRFDMAAGASTLTEVSGPTLAPTQKFTYDGTTYTIMSVNPGAGSFTVYADNFLFVNKGAAITNGVGLMGCSR